MLIFLGLGLDYSFKGGITQKRKTLLSTFIQKQGYITTEDLKERYNDDHPPRAVNV
jgi:hypothetical protein